MTHQNDSNKAMNRLRAAAGLIPIIESGLAKAQMTPGRVENMCHFCTWAMQAEPEGDIEATKLRGEILEGLERIKASVKLLEMTENIAA